MRCDWKWKDEQLPARTDDVIALVPLARLARKKWVDFEWELDRNELEALRWAIREWLPKETGRFRAFDTHLVTAIEAALGDAGGPFEAADKAGRFTVTKHDGTFRIEGNTTFDVAFGYASPGADSKLPGANHLTETMRAALVRGFEPLGWDVRKLSSDAYRPVRNAIYGFAPGYGLQQVPAKGEPLVIPVGFHGPFRLVEGGDAPCLFTQPESERSGVYLWTVFSEAGFRPWYVGQTRRSFAIRTAEHVRSYLSGEYRLYLLDSVRAGTFRTVEGPPAGASPSMIPAFLSALPERVPRILELLSHTFLFVAPLELDRHAMDRVEGAIGRHYKNTEDLKHCLEPGLRVPDAIPGDRTLVLQLSWSQPILGLPSELREP